MKILLIIIISLSIMLLTTPIIWLEIGIDGYEYYGKDVSHVYIYGATILGKDKDWWGINFAYKFQLFFILLFIVLSVLNYIKIKNKKSSMRFGLINLMLLLLFPIWLKLYSDSVLNNSDGANLTPHLHFGILIYLVLLVQSVSLVMKQRKLSINLKT